ncbi:MAG: hypothetical protein HXY41_16445 [Chloroflexi bacterium]|nr:hypothetical protein [Chloroflexota bacterium]
MVSKLLKGVIPAIAIAVLAVSFWFVSRGLQTAPIEVRINENALHLGILGDSAIDEYQGTDHRGGDYHRTTFNWLEHLVINGKVYAGTWGDWGEPRRVGYEYNWARSAATPDSLIAEGQHTGLAEQVAAGQIDVVFLSVGGIEFAPYREDYLRIYDGRLSGDALQQKIDGIIADITLAVDTVQTGKAVPVLLATLGNYNYSPLVQQDSRFADADKRQRVTDAINATNAALAELAASRENVILVDQDLLLKYLLDNFQDGHLLVGGEAVNFYSIGDEPHNGILGDGIHPGTVIAGVMANFYIDYLNQAFDPDIDPLTDEEILALAGL